MPCFKGIVSVSISSSSYIFWLEFPINVLIFTLKGMWQSSFNINIRMSFKSSGTKTLMSFVLPSIKFSEESKGTRPKKWSPWAWLINILSIFVNFMPDFHICVCVPSPQSTINNLSCTLTTCEVVMCLPIGMAAPQPNMFTSNFSIFSSSIFVVVYMNRETNHN